MMQRGQKSRMGDDELMADRKGVLLMSNLLHVLQLPPPLLPVLLYMISIKIMFIPDKLFKRMSYKPWLAVAEYL